MSLYDERDIENYMTDLDVYYNGVIEDFRKDFWARDDESMNAFLKDLEESIEELKKKHGVLDEEDAKRI